MVEERSWLVSACIVVRRIAPERMLKIPCCPNLDQSFLGSIAKDLGYSSSLSSHSNGRYLPLKSMEKVNSAIVNRS